MIQVLYFIFAKFLPKQPGVVLFCKIRTLASTVDADVMLIMSLPNPCIRWATELDSFRGYWRYRNLLLLLLLLLL